MAHYRMSAILHILGGGGGGETDHYKMCNLMQLKIKMNSNVVVAKIVPTGQLKLRAIPDWKEHLPTYALHTRTHTILEYYRAGTLKCFCEHSEFILLTQIPPTQRWRVSFWRGA